jgi:hypothetical protein
MIMKKCGTFAPKPYEKNFLTEVQVNWPSPFNFTMLCEGENGREEKSILFMVNNPPYLFMIYVGQQEIKTKPGKGNLSPAKSSLHNSTS